MTGRGADSAESIGSCGGAAFVSGPRPADISAIAARSAAASVSGGAAAVAGVLAGAASVLAGAAAGAGVMAACVETTTPAFRNCTRNSTRGSARGNCVVSE